MPDAWLHSVRLNASIEIAGIEYLKNEKDRENKDLVDNSIMATNKSLQDTNLAMVKNFEEQAKINQGIIDNSVRQTDILSGQADILKKQTWIFFATAVFALLACIIAGISLGVEIRKDQSEKQLQQQTKELQLLKKQDKTIRD